MKDDLLNVYEEMYGSKNTIEQVQAAITENLRGSDTNTDSIIEAYSKVSGYPKNEPAKPESATEHVPDEVEPAVEAPEELSPAVNSSTSKEKLTKTITDKEKKQMTSHKFSFDELYKIALKEQVEDMPGPGMDDLGGEGLGDEEIGGEEGEITVTLSRDAAQALCDVLSAALEGGEEEGFGGEDELGGEEGFGGGDELGEDELEEATDLQKAPKAASGAGAKGHQKVQDTASANAYIGDFAKANIDPHKNVKGVKKPQELKHKTTAP